MERNNLRFIFIILLVFKFTFSFAQQNETINTDRPDQSDGTYILPKKYLQIENGVTTLNGFFVNNLMLRYGITNSTELRLLCDYGKDNQLLGFMPLGLSFKQRIINENKIIPAVTFVAYARNENIASKDFKSKNFTYSFLLAFQNTITENFSIGYNVSTNSIKNNIGFTTSLSYSLNEKYTVFSEYFSQFNNLQLPQHNIDFGLMYLLKNNLQFDIAFGKSLTASNDLIYLTTGICYKFKLHK